MKKAEKKWIQVLGFLFICLALSILAACGAQTTSGESEEEGSTDEIAYPEKEISLIVPWAAGGGTDAIGRQIASFMEQELGQPVVVVNREGGGGVVGFKEIANSEPDGYTIGFISNSLLLQKYSSETFVEYESFEPITLVNQDPASLTVKGDAPWNSLSEFMEAAKSSNLKVSNSGPGGIWHVSALKMASDNGLEFTHVPYDGANPATVAAAGGFVEATTVSVAEAQSLVDAGELKILGVAAEERLPQFPDIPTFKEEGFNTSIGVWRGFVAPKGTPEEIINVLDEAISKAVETDEYKKFMSDAGYGIRHALPADFAEFMKQEDQAYKELFENIEN